MRTEKNILIAFLLNISFSIIEFIGGTITNSVSIISDSIHDMGDAISIGVSYFLEKISKKNPDKTYTYGYIRFSVLGGLITTIILSVGSILVIIASIKRIINPQFINYKGMIVFAIIGLITNGIAAYYTRDGNSLNQNSVNLHMLEDVLGWLLVLIGSVIMNYTDISLIDPILSILVAIFILYNVYGNLKTIMDLFLEKIPDNIDVDALKNDLIEINGIKDVHHIHVWSIDGYSNYATMHVTSNINSKEIKDEIRSHLKKYQIVHVTIEIEDEKEECCENNCKVTREFKKHCNHHNHVHHHHHE